MPTFNLRVRLKNFGMHLASVEAPTLEEAITKLRSELEPRWLIESGPSENVPRQYTDDEVKAMDEDEV